MPAGRVLATHQARDAAKQLLAATGSVKEQVERVLRHGAVLANPGHWDGGLAGQWRNDWGLDANHLRQTAATLGELEHRAHQAVEDIFKADSAAGSASAGAVLATDKSPRPPRTEEKDQGLLGDIGGFFSGALDIAKRYREGVRDGAVGFVTGLGGLIGRDPTTGKWSWSAAGTAWAGMGKFALALGVYSIPGGTIVDQTVGVPGLERGELGNTLLNAGKALIAYDEWGKDPARAAGMTGFNIAAAIVGTKGAGTGLRAARSAAKKTEEGAAKKGAEEGVAKKTTEEAVAKKKATNDAIDKAKNSVDKDRRLEGEVADSIRDHVIDFERKVGPNGSVGEVDVETGKAIVEVTTTPRGKLGQIQKLIADRQINPDGKPVILYGPNYGAAATKAIEDAGGHVARTPEELKTLLRRFGEG